MSKQSMLVHHKATDLGRTIPPISELIADTHSIIRFTNLEGQEVELDFRDQADLDPYPIPMPIDREGYGSVETSARFWATGHCDWLNVRSAMEKYLPGYSPDAQPVEKPLRLLDFGCASGRFLRHAHTFGGDQLEAWGCDFSPENIAWNKTHFPPAIKTFLNNANPHLPFPDGYFDVITAFSVFTHIDHFEDAWLLELKRITRGDGLLYLTTQNDATWSAVPGRPSYWDHIQKVNLIESNQVQLTESMFTEPMPLDRMAFRMSDNDVYNCNVWHSNEYLQSHWSRYFHIHQIAANAHSGFQSPVIMCPLAAG